VQHLEGIIEELAAGMEVLPHGGVVVRPGSRRNSEGEPAAGKLVDARRALGQQHRRVDGCQQDVGHQLDPARRTSSRS